MLAVELHVEWIVDVATGADGDANAVLKVGIVVAVRRLWWVGLRLVKLEADLAQIVKLRDSGALNFGINTAFKNAIEECVDMGFLREVKEALGIVGRLHVLKISHDLPEERE